MPTKLIAFIPDDLADWVKTHSHIIGPGTLPKERVELARIGYDDGWEA